MSRRKIVKVNPFSIGEDWVPNTSSIIEMLGDKQVTEDSGKHNLENDLVRAFRGNEQYTLSYVNGTGASKVEPYLSLSGLYYSGEDNHLHGIWNEKPRPVVITGTTAGNTLEIDSQEFSCEVPCEDGATLVYNLIPNETYTWTETNTGRSGTFETEGTVRQLYVDALPNLRDIGGYTCYESDGTTVAGTMRYGKLFRGFGFIPMLSKETGKVQYTNIDYGNRVLWDAVYADYKARVEDIFAKLVSFGVTKELDLRQYNSSYSPASKGIYSSNGDATNSARNPQYDGIADWYNEFEIGSYGNASSLGVFITSANYTHNSSTSKTSSVQNLYNCLNLIVDTIDAGGGVWYHCKTGADRTGILTAVIMAACGCSIDDIVKEYELTSMCRSGTQPNLVYNTSGSTSTSLRTFIKNNVKYTTSSSGTLWEAILAKVTTTNDLRKKMKVLGDVLRAQLVKTASSGSENDYNRKIAFIAKKFQPSTSQLTIWSKYSESSYDNYRFCEVSVKQGDVITVVLETNLRVWFIEAENSILQRMTGSSNITTGFLVDSEQTEFTQVKPSTGVYQYTVSHAAARKVLVAIDLEQTILGIDKRYVVVSEG